MSGDLVRKKPAEPKRARSGVRVASMVLLGVAAAGGGFALVRKETPRAVAAASAAEAAPSHALEVPTRVVSASSLSRAIRVTGTLKSNEVVKISTKATGLVRQVRVEEGDRVRAGDLLVQVDDRELQAQRARAVASVQAALANVTAAQANQRVAEAKFSQAGTSKTVKDASAESEVRQAEQTLAAANSRLSQAKSQVGIETTQAETRVASARSALQSAKERLKALQEGSRRQETASAQANVAQVQAQTEKLRGNLARREQLLRDGAISSEEVENARRDYEASQASLNAAKQQLDLVMEGPRGEEVRVGEEAVRQAQSALQDAEATRARQSISNQDVLSAEAQVRLAQAALEAAQAGLGQREINAEEILATRAAVSQARAAVGQANAAVAQARAEVRNLDAQISQTRIYSPVDGVVSEKTVHVGESLSATTGGLLTVVASNSAYLEATAPETALPYLRPGSPAAVTLDAQPGKTLAGTLREVIPVTGENTRSVRLRIAVSGVKASETNVIGGFGRATLQGGSAAPVISIPRAALVSDQGQYAVFVVKDGKAERRTVEVGLRTGKSAEIRTGLRIGEQVVTDGASRLTDGQAVTAKSGA